MTSPSVNDPPHPAWSLPPRPAHLTRRRVIVVLVVVVLLAGGGELVGIPKILRWRFASQSHARALEEELTGARPTRQFSPDANFIQLSGGFLPGDQQPITIDTGTLPVPTRIDTVMAKAATILTGRGYTQDDVAMSYPGLWNCRFDGTPDAQGLITAATSMTCYVSRRHGREHAEIAVVTTAVPPQYSISYGSSSGPNPDITGVLVTDVQVTVKD